MGRRFPPPWRVAETSSQGGCGSFRILDSAGEAVAYVYYDDGDLVRRGVTGHPTRDEARRVAAGLSRLPVLLGVWEEGGDVCNLYSLTKGQAAIRELTRALIDRTGNLPPMPGIFPDYPAPIVRNGSEGRELVLARWGTPSS